jgi:hypothetical protein
VDRDVKMRLVGARLLARRLRHRHADCLGLTARGRGQEAGALKSRSGRRPLSTRRGQRQQARADRVGKAQRDERAEGYQCARGMGAPPHELARHHRDDEVCVKKDVRTTSFPRRKSELTTSNRPKHIIRAMILAGS